MVFPLVLLFDLSRDLFFHQSGSDCGPKWCRDTYGKRHKISQLSPNIRGPHVQLTLWFPGSVLRELLLTTDLILSYPPTMPSVTFCNYLYLMKKYDGLVIHKKKFLKSTEVKSRFLGRHNRSPIRIRGSTVEWPWSQWTWVWIHNSCETLACYEAHSASATSHAHGKIMVPTPGALCRAKKSIQIKKRDTYVAHMRHLVIVTAIRSSLNVLLYYMIPLEEYSRRWENAPSERVPATVTAILSVWHRWQYKDLILKYVPIRHENTEGFERKHNCCIDFTTTHMIAQKTSFWATYNRL